MSGSGPELRDRSLSIFLLFCFIFCPKVVFFYPFCFVFIKYKTKKMIFFFYFLFMLSLPPFWYNQNGGRSPILIISKWGGGGIKIKISVLERSFGSGSRSSSRMGTYQKHKQKTLQGICSRTLIYLIILKSKPLPHLLFLKILVHFS